MNNTITVIDIEENGISVLVGYSLQGKQYVLSARHSGPLSLDPATHFPDSVQRKSLLLERMNKTKRALNESSLGATILLLPSDGFSIRGDVIGTSAVALDRISLQDYNNCNLRLRKRAEKDRANESVVSVVPFSFQADQTFYDIFPSGVQAESLGVTTDIHRVSHPTYAFYRDRMESIGRKPYLTFFSAYALISYRNSINAPKNYFLLDYGTKSSTLSFVNKGRLARTYPLGYGRMSLINNASKKLSVSYDHCKELFALFGFCSLSGFPYQGKDAFTVEERTKAFEDSLLPVSSFLKNTRITGTPVYLTGEATKIVSFTDALSKQTGREVKTFASNCIGAKDSCYLPSLGALLLASRSYQPSPDEGKKAQQQYDLGKEPLKRD